MKKPPPAPKLRNGRMSDVAALLALEQEFFTPDHRISRRSFRRFLHSPHAKLLVAAINGKVAGCALVLYRQGSRRARLYTIAVGREFQGRGLARWLLTAAQTHAKRRGCRSMRLEVRADDAGTIALYESSGYRPFGRRRRYYAGRIDALRFEKPL
ncbi:MAG TPA: GNAT family N-acetyltransferase [Xanthobacteraceae bacterium]|nr:GNAT family N-acetyltransferase [Xanthobacteraceae bacterium]